MALVKLRNVNPLGQVDMPLLARQGEPIGEHGSGCLEPGEVFDVDKAIAGRPPTYDAAGVMTNPGVGLLAQVGNYELADAPKPQRPRKPAAKKKPTPPPDAAMPAASPVETPEG